MILYKNPVMLSILSGVLLTLSWPVQGLSFLIFFSLIPLFFVEDLILKDEFETKKYYVCLPLAILDFSFGI